MSTMQPYYLNLDITGKYKTSDIITMNPDTPQELYYRLFDGQYEIDYGIFEELRLILEDNSNNNVYTVSSNQVVEVNGEKRIRIIIPLEATQGHYDYIVRPVFKSGGVNKSLVKFKILSRIEITPDMTATMTLMQKINNIYNTYLDSVKREEVGAPLGLVPLDENTKIFEQYIPNNIVHHIHELYEGHGLRLNENYLIEYWDTQDLRFYELNLIYGGKFDHERKPSSFDYFGGTF